MSTGDPSRLLAGVPGRLIARAGADFSSFATTAYPYGGVELGLVGDGRLTRVEGTYDVHAEEYGGVEVVEEVPTGDSWVYTANLRSWDDDALLYVFGQTKVGALMGRRVVVASGGTSTPLGVGEGRSRRWSGGLRIAFVADDPVNRPSLLLPQAIARTVRELEVPLTLRDEAGISCSFRGLRPVTGTAASWGPLADLP